MILSILPSVPETGFANIDDTVYSEIDTPFQLKINQTARIESENLQIELLKIIDDSRCESVDNCGPYGTVSVLVQVKDGKDQKYLALSSDTLHQPTIPSMNGSLIQIESVDPFPIHGNVTNSDYIVTFIISKRDANWKTYELSGEFLAANHASYQEFRIPYKTTNGELNKIAVSQKDDGSLMAEIKNAADGGKFNIVIPRNLFDSTLDSLDVDEKFFVIIDGREVISDEIRTPCFRNLLIEYGDGSGKIEIVGSNILMGPEPVMSQVSPVNVGTDKQVYSMGDKVATSGCIPLNMRSDDVRIDILNHKGEIIKTVTVAPNIDGTFFYSFVIDEGFDYGDYVLRATFADYMMVKNFSVNKGSAESLVNDNIQKFLLALNQSIKEHNDSQEITKFVGSDLVSPAPLSPYKQFKSGIKAEDVICKSGLQLVMKKSNGYPLCVKGTSTKKLTERKFIPEYNGWDSEIPVDKLITNATKN